MIHIYHHNDADGRLSAAIAALKYEGATSVTAFHELSYGPAPSFEDVSLGDDVWIVDYHFKDPDLERLIQICGVKAVTWIDHHASCSDSKYLHLVGARSFVNKGPAACQLTWKHCYPDIPEPRFVTLVGDYDSWAMKFSPECRQFYEAIKGDPGLQRPEGWLGLLKAAPHVQEEWTCRAVAEGAAVIRYRDGYLAGLRKTFGYTAVLGDPRWKPLWKLVEGSYVIPSVPVLNVQQFGSAAFTPDQMANNPLCMTYCHDGLEFTVSLYSEDPTTDCGQIAKAFGGGGHRGAAGFKCTTLPWERAFE